MGLADDFIENLKKRKMQQYDFSNGACYDDSIIEVGKDTDGIVRNNMELHALILKIIKEIDRICRKNNIPYALAFGSALGVYNYKGFIPWDDDADIAMDYLDTKRFIEACLVDLNDEFYFNCYETNEEYNVLIPTIKVGLKDTYLKEINDITLPNKCKEGNGIFVDIVNFMGVPEDFEEHKKILSYTKKKVPLYVFQDAFLRINPKSLKEKIKYFENNVYQKFKDSSRVAQTVIIPWQDININLSHLSYPRDMIYPFKEYEFEGEKFFSFNKLEEFVRFQYGDEGLRKWDGKRWIDPYPVRKRKMKHLYKFNLNHKV